MLFWSGQSVSLLGSQVSGLAIPVLAVATFRISAFQMGLLTMLGNLPWLLLSLPAGVVVDRCRKSRVMLWCDIGRGLTLLWIPVAAALGVLDVAQLFGVSIASSVLSVFFTSAYLSFPATILSKEQLVDATGKVSATASIARVAGPSLSGFLLDLAGAARIIALDGVSYLVSAATLGMIRDEDRARADTPRSRGDFRKEMRQGLRLLLDNRTSACLTFANALGNVVLTAINTLWLLYALRDLGWTVRTVGVVAGAGAVGGVLGSLGAKALIERCGMVRVMLFGLLVFAPGQFVVALVHRGPGGPLIVAAGTGAGMAALLLYDIAQRSYRVSSCPREMLGRLNATTTWLQWGLRPLAGLAAGALGTWIGPHAAMAAFGLLLPLCPLALWLSPLRTERIDRGAIPLNS